jgi:hypothetical protein
MKNGTTTICIIARGPKYRNRGHAQKTGVTKLKTEMTLLFFGEDRPPRPPAAVRRRETPRPPYIREFPRAFLYIAGKFLARFI